MVKSNNGLFVSDKKINGYSVFFDEACTQPVPMIRVGKYPGIDNQYLKYPNNGLSGQYVHAMIVFAFGDCRNHKYVPGTGDDIDHLDMDHENFNRDNLQVISHIRNLFRASYACSHLISYKIYEQKEKDGTLKDDEKKKLAMYRDCTSRYKAEFANLSESQKMEHQAEITIDLNNLESWYYKIMKRWCK